jgi:hypothetical protein
MIPENLFERDEPRTRRTDPFTSALAARELLSSGAFAKQKQAVYQALQWNDGATSAELSRAMTAQDRYLCSRRLPDLERAGLVRRGPARKCKATHRRCITWHVL